MKTTGSGCLNCHSREEEEVQINIFDYKKKLVQTDHFAIFDAQNTAGRSKQVQVTKETNDRKKHKYALCVKNGF